MPLDWRRRFPCTGGHLCGPAFGRQTTPNYCICKQYFSLQNGDRVLGPHRTEHRPFQPGRPGRLGRPGPNRRRICAGQPRPRMNGRRSVADGPPDSPFESGDVLGPRVGSVTPLRRLGGAKDVRAWHRRWRGCPRLVHGADPLDPKRRCGQGVGNPTSTSARATPAHAEACATVDELGDVRGTPD